MTLMVYVWFKRALVSWTLLVVALVGAWLAIYLLPLWETARGRAFGSSELTKEIEVLFDPSARGDVRRNLSGSVKMMGTNRPGTLIGVPTELSARVTLHNARLSKADGERVLGETSFLTRLDRTASLFPETVVHTVVSTWQTSREKRSSSTLVSGETSELRPFVNQLCTYQAEAEVTLFQPEIVCRLPQGKAGAWRDDRLAIRVAEAEMRVAYTGRQLRRSCLPRAGESGK